jgi:hypothetical protein
MDGLGCGGGAEELPRLGNEVAVEIDRRVLSHGAIVCRM